MIDTIATAANAIGWPFALFGLVVSGWVLQIQADGLRGASGSKRVLGAVLVIVLAGLSMFFLYSFGVALRPE